MFDITRELIAYGLLAVIAFAALPWLTVTLIRRRQRNLRRRGIKRYGH